MVGANPVALNNIHCRTAQWGCNWLPVALGKRVGRLGQYLVAQNDGRFSQYYIVIGIVEGRI